MLPKTIGVGRVYEAILPYPLNPILKRATFHIKDNSNNDQANRNNARVKERYLQISFTVIPGKGLTQRTEDSKSKYRYKGIKQVL